MFLYILKRILSAIPVIFLGLTITFFIVRLTPGDPTAKYISPAIDPSVREVIIKRFGLQEPVYIQYLKWIDRFILHFDFGTSFESGIPVSEILKEAIPNTFILTFLAFFISVILGVALGVISAVRKDSLIDNFTSISSILAYSIPIFWLGLMSIVLFSVVLKWLPSSHMKSLNYNYLTFIGKIADRIKHLIMPAAVLGVGSAAVNARYMRNSLLEVINQDYIVTARSKGLSEKIVILKHAMRNAVLPIITLGGLSIPFLLSGSVITEIVFSWPGMGRVTVTAILARDYPIVIASSFLAFCAVIAGNLMADLGYALADPRIKLVEK
ncbi:MAG: ABC transporter permease [Fidelibacterota bacterium]